MKTCLKIILAFAMFLVISLDLGQAYAERPEYITKNGVSIAKLAADKADGAVQISGNTKKDKIKIMLTKGNKQEWYDVSIKDGEFSQKIWLTEGAGTYRLDVMVHEYDRKYSYGPGLTVENISDADKYIVPGKYIESDDERILKLAEELTDGLKSDREKAEAIYGWVKDNVEYDYIKYEKHKENDYDNEYGAVNALETGKGVCFDYAALTAALGRATGLRTKLVEGEIDSAEIRGFHAWNEFYISDEGKWINVDTTLAATTGKDYFDISISSAYKKSMEL